MKFFITTMITAFFLISTSPVFAQGVKNLKAMGKAFTEIAKNTSPAVVFIETEKKQQISSQSPFFLPFDDIDGFSFENNIFKYFFKENIPPRNKEREKGRERTHKVLGQGSGFIFSKSGHILTNNHVVGDADKVVVKLLDGRSFEAKVIGTDQHSDVAVIKINVKNLTVLPLGNSNSLEVGEWVLALGNPFGLSHTLTAGIVSARGRSSVGITDYENFIQTDAAINLGNSGGPLINLDGKAVGMNTAIFSRTGGSMGIGFAIPINMIKGIKDQLIKKGKVIRGYLGIVIQNLTKDLSQQFGIEGIRGILISDVKENTPAKKALLRTGDIIIKFDGKEVNEVGTFRNMVASTQPGEKKHLTIFRNGKNIKIKVKIGKLPAKQEFAKSQKFQENEFGFSVDNLTRDLRQQYGISGNEQGVVVSEVDPFSVAKLAGIKPGMLIKEVNRMKVDSVSDFRKAIKKTKRKKSVLLLVQDGEFSRYITLSIK